MDYNACFEQEACGECRKLGKDNNGKNCKGCRWTRKQFANIIYNQGSESIQWGMLDTVNALGRENI